MPGLQGLMAMLAAAFAIGAVRGYDLIENDYETDVDRATTTSQFQQSNPCKLSGSRAGIGLGIGNSRRKTKGLFKTGMLFVDFPDAIATDSPTTLYNRLKPSINWYNMSSYGRMNLQIEPHMKFLRMKGRSDSFGWSRNTAGLKMNQYISEALTASGSTSPFKGAPDALYIVPTRAAKSIWFSPTSPSPGRGANGIHVTGGVVTFGQDMWGTFNYKLLNHENGHILGLPDLYPMDSARLPTTYYVGGWSLMGLISGTAPDYFAWEKWKLGWIDDNQVSCVSKPGTSEHMLTPLGSSGGTKMVAIRLNSTTSLNIELRTKSGLDSDTCSRGLLFYTVGINTPSGKGPIRVIDPANGKGCNAGRGGKLSGAAQDFRRGIKSVNLAQYGVGVKVNGLQGQNYKLAVSRASDMR